MDTDKKAAWVDQFNRALIDNHGWGQEDLDDMAGFSDQYQALTMGNGWREWADPSTGYGDHSAAAAADWLASQYD